MRIDMLVPINDCFVSCCNCVFECGRLYAVIQVSVICQHRLPAALSLFHTNFPLGVVPECHGTFEAVAQPDRVAIAPLPEQKLRHKMPANELSKS